MQFKVSLFRNSMLDKNLHPLGFKACAILFMLISSSYFISCTELLTPVFPLTNTFDKNEQGWEVSQGVIKKYIPIEGNPGGHLYGVDNANGFWYFVASTDFLISLRKAYGLQLSFDLQQSATDSQVVADDVILTDGILTLTYRTSYPPKITWTSYSVKLDDSAGWKNGKVKATKAELQQVLQNITSLKIRGEYRAGPDQGGIDNVSIH